MKKVKFGVRVTTADTISDTLVRLYKESVAGNSDSTFAKDANLAAIMGEIEKLSADTTTAIKRDKISTSLEEADVKRDDIIRQLGTLLTGYSAIPLADKKLAAEKLLAVYDKYGKAIVNEPYARESSLIESMLEDFGNADLSDSTNVLEGVGDLLKSLREAQDAFNKESDSNTAAITSKGDSAYALKKPLLLSINEKLVPYLTALGTLPDYKDFVAKCDAEIIKANASVPKKKPAVEG
jgi:hypothetical protein